MLERLFSSRVRARLLIVFFSSTEQEFSARDLATYLGENYSSVWKELVNLHEMGILKSHVQRGIRLYSVDETCPFSEELKNIVRKTEGIPERIRRSIHDIPGIKVSFIFGSLARSDYDNRSDVDLLVIGEVDLQEISKRVAKLEKDISRPINYVLYSQTEWKAKKLEDIPFINNILHSKKIFMVGGENDL